MTTSRGNWFPGRRKRRIATAAVSGTLAGIALAVSGASISEPATVFYGKIVGTGSERPFVVTDGQIRWQLRDANGAEIVLQARLWPQGGGEFSYRLSVPHTALSAGLQASPNAVALRRTEETLSHARITVNGKPARFVGSVDPSFDIAQVRRAATYRLDLEVPLVAPDADADGLPDWWEAQNGLTDSDDTDPDRDGVSNRQEYLAGTNPRQNGKAPVLLTTELAAYADGTTGVYLNAQDSDSPATALVYRVTETPKGAQLMLRNTLPSTVSPDLVLGVGATFTQADVLAGRLILNPEGARSEATSFRVSLGDEDPSHARADGAVAVSFYRPDAGVLRALSAEQRISVAQGLSSLPGGVSAAESARVQRYLQGAELGAVIWDRTKDETDVKISSPSTGLAPREYTSHYVASFGPERRQILAGGSGRDVLQGGMADDVLAGGNGADRLIGGGGSDRFAFADHEADGDVVEDFKPVEGDVLDLDRVFEGSAGDLRDHIRIAGGTDGAVLTLQKPGLAPMSLRLAGVPVDSVDLAAWIADGRLRAGKLSLPARISILARQAQASENGPRSATLELVRTGTISDATTVTLGVRGSAANGVDFATLPQTVTFAPGERTVALTIQPYSDSASEPRETVEVTVAPGIGYEVGPNASATATIEDLAAVLTVEALEPFGATRSLTAGAVLLRREALIDRDLLVRLDVRGSATAGSDYQPIPRFLSLKPGQTTALISVQPVAGAELAGGAETVEVTIVPSSDYQVGTTPTARVVLVESTTTFAMWRSQHFPGATGSLDAFGASDPGGHGVSALLRYAFGLDPKNPDRTRLPRIVVRDGHLTLDVWQRPGATDIELVAEVSTDMIHWDAAGTRVERMYPPQLSGDAATVCFRAVPAIAETPQLFLNLRVVHRP